MKEIMNFDDMIKTQKATEWLLQNDSFVVGVYGYMKDNPAMSIMIAAIYGGDLGKRIEAKAAEMCVTDDDRKFGYPRRQEHSDTVLPYDLTYRV